MGRKKLMKFKRGDVVFARLSHHIKKGDDCKKFSKKVVIKDVFVNQLRLIVEVDGEKRSISFNAVVRPEDESSVEYL